ncbi:NADH-ubiquinone oxidoreductase 29.9 kDa subunit [Escovopsis weberi]|uniref:NADH-ubiquinone oxidoreductase 29.9 kDa subunit n=1 Tax=Escovopsis weberi TaxID=150374 RepID=A0A0M8N7E3_ESCWE|nr:NADH-ubiquinone oxidoreductase 29.9 kDa subunit [Escovopsis weberi]
MRPTVRALARYLEAGTPTGLTGLWTHSTPRSTLLYLYNSTLQRLQSIPETSLYRQSVEAVTKHRLALVEKTAPPGHEQWAARAKELLSKNNGRFRVTGGPSEGSGAQVVKLGDRVFVVGIRREAGDVRVQEWNGDEDDNAELDNILTPGEEHEEIEWQDEPQLTAEQVQELEGQIGAGLIEEVIQVAEGELQLVETMIEGKVWEDLEEKPQPGQWTYFERQ